MAGIGFELRRLLRRQTYLGLLSAYGYASVVSSGPWLLSIVQGLVIALLLLLGADLVRALGLSPLYARLFYVDVAGAGLQVLLLAIVNVFFYLDQRRIVLGLSALLLVANAGLTAFTQSLGLAFYGYGFAGSMLLTAIVGLALLSRKLDRLEYETFMFQPFS